MENANTQQISAPVKTTGGLGMQIVAITPFISCGYILYMTLQQFYACLERLAPIFYGWWRAWLDAQTMPIAEMREWHVLAYIRADIAGGAFHAAWPAAKIAMLSACILLFVMAAWYALLCYAEETETPAQ